MKYAGSATPDDLYICLGRQGATPRAYRNPLFTQRSNNDQREIRLEIEDNYRMPVLASRGNRSSTQKNHRINTDQTEINTVEKEVKEPCSSDDLNNDLPHQCLNHENLRHVFDDLMPENERVERFMIEQNSSINLFAFPGDDANTIRCRSPNTAEIDLSTLLDILN